LVWSIVLALQNRVLQNHALQNHALQNHALQNKAALMLYSASSQ
jgi:hypothetical protein